MTEILFPLGGPRLTTILALAVFLAIAITRGEKKPALACLAWLFGFEFLFEATTFALGRPELGAIHAATYIIIGALLLPWLTRRGVIPSLPLLAAALAVWAIWVATGFHVNEHTGAGFDPAAEVLNELSKMLWAAAYLLPLLSTTRGPQPTNSSVKASS